MKKNFLFLFILITFANPILSQSNLLESVRNNPGDAKKICNKFKEFNSKGISASSDRAIEYVSKTKKLSSINAEILSIYVIGLHCPQVI